MSLEQAEVLRYSWMPAPSPSGEVDADLDVEPKPARETVDAVPTRAERLPQVPDVHPGFTKVIAQGHLSVEQAMLRGDRDAFAFRLTRAHGLTGDLAYRVTDNRISLREACELNRGSPTATAFRAAASRSPVSRSQMLVVLGAATLALSFMFWQVWSNQLDAEHAPVPRAHVTPPVAADPVEETVRPAVVDPRPLLSATNVRTDEKGRVLEVVGPDPASVLVAYCEAGASVLGLAPLEITSTIPRFRTARLGLFRDRSAPDSIYAIRIRKDAETGRWIAGGKGDTPIPIKVAPNLPPDSLRIPVRRL
jgi:hypothetical protein